MAGKQFFLLAGILALLLVACGEATAPAASEPSRPLDQARSVAFVPQDVGTSVASARAVAKTPLRAAPRTPREAKTTGCQRAMPSGVKAGTTSVRTLVTAGIQRQYRLHLAPSFTNASRTALILNFHGRTSTASEQESYSGLVTVSDREGFILVSPEGMGSPRGWSAGATPPGTIDDVGFTSDLLDTLERELCVDAARVYATGFSNGAFLASRLACEMPDRITAAAAVGGIHFPANSCAGQVPILAIHGAADDVVPIAGGMVRQMKYAGAYDAIARWAASNGCAADFREEWLGESVARLVYQDCPASTSLVVLRNVGHLWPGSPLLLESQRTSLNAAEMIWSFFSLQAM